MGQAISWSTKLVSQVNMRRIEMKVKVTEMFFPDRLTEITFPSARTGGMKQSLVHQQMHPHTHGFQTNTAVLTGVQGHTHTRAHAKHHKTGARGFSSPHKCVASMPDGPCMCRKQVPLPHRQLNIKRSNGHQSKT